jgi:hypothetical protein
VVEICVHCKRGAVYGEFVAGQWTHLNGGRYCLDEHGYTATPLRVATPVYHPRSAVL